MTTFADVLAHCTLLADGCVVDATSHGVMGSVRCIWNERDAFIQPTEVIRLHDQRAEPGVFEVYDDCGNESLVFTAMRPARFCLPHA